MTGKLPVAIMKKVSPKLKQPTPQDLTDALLEFIKVKFYTGPEGARCFAQDRSRLLAWVVLWPASWLNERGVTIHGEAYKAIFVRILLQADQHRSERITYRPAWLKMVVQSHWRLHGEEYYNEAKSMRSVTEQLLVLAGHRTAAPDPVKDLAAAHRVLAGVKRSKTVAKMPVKTQLNLFG